MTTAYGINRADWSYIPGGVASGTALIRPDFPELKDFPYLWQQGEYVLGGGSSNYMFLVLAADQVLSGESRSNEVSTTSRVAGGCVARPRDAFGQKRIKVLEQ